MHVHLAACDLYYLDGNGNVLVRNVSTLQPSREGSYSCILTGNKKIAVNPRLAGTLNAPRSHCLRVEKDSSEEEMGFLDSTNEEKMVERKVRGDQSHVRQSKRELQVGESRSSERTIWTLKREQFIADSEKVRDFS